MPFALSLIKMMIARKSLRRRIHHHSSSKKKINKYSHHPRLAPSFRLIFFLPRGVQRRCGMTLPVVVVIHSCVSNNATMGLIPRRLHHESRILLLALSDSCLQAGGGSTMYSSLIPPLIPQRSLHSSPSRSGAITVDFACRIIGFNPILIFILGWDGTPSPPTRPE